MSKQKTVFVRNHKKRVYNGIWYMQISEIPRKYLTQYLISWFLEFDPKEWKSIWSASKEQAIDQPEKVVHDVDEAKEYLNKHNIKFAKNMKDENIIKRAVENGWKTEATSPNVNDNDLSALNEDNGQEDEDQLDALKN